MIELVKAILSFCLQMAVFFCGGTILLRGMRRKPNPAMALILGYLAYFALFEVIVLPMIFLWVPLHICTMMWSVFFLVIIVTGLVIWKKQQRVNTDFLRTLWQNHGWMIAAAAAAVVLQCLLVAFYSGTSQDSAYYIGMTSASVYTDTLGRYSPYTGNLLEEFYSRYVFSAYPMHNAVWCDLLGIHALVQANVVMPVIHVILFNLIIYEIGLRLFHGGRKQADLMIGIVCLMQLFTNTAYTNGAFFFTRLYEGKALLANGSVMVVLLCSIWYWQREEQRQIWVVLFLNAMSAVCFSGSSIFLPAASAAGMLPCIVRRKRYQDIGWLVICALPQIVYLILYYSAKLGWIVLKAS